MAPSAANLRFRSLAVDLHAGPADRMIMVMALQHCALLFTADERLIEYARQGHVNVLPV